MTYIMLKAQLNSNQPTSLTKNSPASQTVATARIAPKICQGQRPTMYSECSRFHPNRFTFGGGRAERVNTAKLPQGVNLIVGRSYSFEPNNNTVEEHSLTTYVNVNKLF